jgi:hypothetical protein
MHEPLLANAALAADTRLCGFYLKPYSLGHELFLIRENSPFLFGGPIGPADIFRALIICTGEWKGLRHAQDSYLYLPKLWLIKRAVQKANLEVPENLNRAIEAFAKHRQDGCSEFPISDTLRPERQNSTGRDPGTPFILTLQQFLMLKFRLTEEEAWNYPVGLAKMRWQAFWEQEGGLDIANWFDAHIDEVKRQAEQEEAACKE